MNGATASAGSHLTRTPVDPLAVVVASAAQATLLLDEAGDVVYASDGLNVVLGYRPEDLLGRPLAALVAAADRARISRLLAFLGHGPERTADDVALVHADLSTVRADLVADRLEAANGGRGALVTIRVAGLLDAVRRGDTDTLLPVTVFTLDSRGGCAGIGDRWTRITGQTRVDAGGVGWLCCVHEDDRRGLRAAAAAAHSARVGFRHRFRVETAEGEHQEVEVAVEPALIGDGSSVGLLVPVPGSKPVRGSAPATLTTDAVVHLRGDDLIIELVDTPLR